MEAFHSGRFGMEDDIPFCLFSSSAAFLTAPKSESRLMRDMSGVKFGAPVSSLDGGATEVPAELAGVVVSAILPVDKTCHNLQEAKEKLCKSLPSDVCVLFMLATEIFSSYRYILV